MKAGWQAAMAVILLAAVARGDEKSVSGVGPLKITKSIFSQDLGMLDSEREEYATSLASIAANQFTGKKGEGNSAEDARRLLALALQLSPRNKKALVVGFQLAKGVMPAKSEGNYTPEAFARLLLTRGQLLEKQGGDDNRKLARYFIHIAADLDPRNEDAVYASEVHRIDLGKLDWSEITQDQKAKPDPFESRGD